MVHRRTSMVALTLLLSSVLVIPGSVSPRPALATSTAPPSLALSDAIRFRTDFGLDADPTYVAQVMANPAASSTLSGTPLLPSEQANIEARLAIQRQLPPLEDYVAAHPDVFSGMWIDQPNGGVVVVELSNGDTALPAEAASLVPPGATIRVQSVSNSRATLEALAATISSDMKSLQASGIDVVRVGVDVPKNVVQVGVDGLTSANEAVLLARYGQDLEIIPAAPLQQASLPTGCTSRTNCQLEGGLDVSNLGFMACTSNFFFKYSGLIYLATAGHCYSSTYYKWYEGGNSNYYIGNNFAYSDYNGMSADVMLFTQSVSTPKNIIYASDSTKTQSMTTWDTNSEQIYGQYACRSGYASGYNCSDILGTDLTETVQCLTGTCTEYHMWQLDIRGAGGDSGGPIFNDYIEMGIVDAVNSNYTETYYSTIDWIDSVMGTTPCLTASC